MNTEVEYDTTVEEALLNRLERYASEACARLKDHCSQPGTAPPELRDKFLAAVEDIGEVRIEEIPRDLGAFFFDHGTIRLQREPVLAILDQVLTDIPNRERSLGHRMAAEEILNLRDRVFLVYFLHEIRHRTQGIGNYSDVQRVKEIAGRERVSEFDLLADRDAALAYAAIITPNPSDRAEFLEGFKEALYFSHLYYFRAFTFPADRPDKLARAAAMMLMLARFAAAEEPGFDLEHERLPLDTALRVSLDREQRRLAVFRLEPSQELVQVAEGGSVPILVRHIKSGDFDAALEAAISLLIQLKLAPLRVLD